MTQYVLFGVIIAWVAILSYFIYKLRHHYDTLTIKTRKKHIDEILDSLVHQDESLTKEMKSIGNEIKSLKKNSLQYYQKLGFLRFNPFERIGGEQSFIVALLDASDSGIILNFLYTREGIRVFSKKVINGTGQEFTLSEEEKSVIRNAK